MKKKPRRVGPLRVALSACCATLVVSGCTSAPPAPDWQLNARDAMERAAKAYLSGDAEIEAVEFQRARAEVARTGRVHLVARTELMRCATRVASLVFEDCPAFAALAADSAAPERAYAAYLAGRAEPGDIEVLPKQHRAVAAAGAPVEALRAIEDPLSRLVAAGVWLRDGRDTAAASELAVETASAQGWRRPLMAWLGVQAMAAGAAGRADDAARLCRRLALVSPSAPREPAVCRAP